MTIRVTQGTASVELTSKDYAVTGGATRVYYVADDLIGACRRALAALDDERADALFRLLQEHA